MTTYPQFCGLARAAEIVGERWTLLIVRELLLEPRRYTDLKERLAPITSSVLTARLESLQEKGIVELHEWGGPIPGRVFRLTEDGEALRPVVYELGRWGARFLLPERPGERFDGDWMRLAFECYAGHGPTPPYSYQVRVTHGGSSGTVFVRGGAEGTTVQAAVAEPVDASIEGSPLVLLGVMTGGMDVAAAVEAGELRVEGDPVAARRLPELFA